MSIKNKQNKKNTSFIIIIIFVHLYKSTDPVYGCMGTEGWIWMWFGDNWKRTQNHICTRK